jgi:NAD+--asparagine ADP-ribosyltransferase
MKSKKEHRKIKKKKKRKRKQKRCLKKEKTVIRNRLNLIESTKKSNFVHYGKLHRK